MGIYLALDLQEVNNYFDQFPHWNENVLNQEELLFRRQVSVHKHNL